MTDYSEGSIWLDGVEMRAGCAMYEPDLNEPKRATAELQSHAWMWEEA